MTSSSWVVYLLISAVVGFVCYKRGCHTGAEIGYRDGYKAAAREHFKAMTTEQVQWQGATGGRIQLEQPMITEVPREPTGIPEYRAEAASALVNLGWAHKDCTLPIYAAQRSLQARGAPVTTKSLVVEVLQNHGKNIGGTINE
jgi:hypothetical protein